MKLKWGAKMLEIYGHGGDIHSAGQRYGRRAEEFIDFSANINPLGMPPGLMMYLTEVLPSVMQYPDPGHRNLKNRLASLLHVEEEMILVGNGAAEVMSLILLALSPKVVGVIEPCFSEYATLSRQVGSDVMCVITDEERGFRATDEDLEHLARASDLIFLGQPNNPNGIQYTMNQLNTYAEYAERYGTWLVIDEAFIDFVPLDQRHSLLSELDRYPHLIVVRSMTKFYAIPGLRLGYAVANAQIIQAIAEKQVTWSVNQLALLAGEYCVRSGTAFEEATISFVQRERSRLKDGLQQLGCYAWAGEANFLLVRMPDEWTAERVQEALGRRGILIRSCAMYPGLTSRDIRVAVRTESENLLLLQELSTLLGGERE
ncbi:threonine-phosphate decarboxylase [Paenibacillus shirakamiensis]|uniref:threonine-phosphate decarboxylase n=1 Tax=Paenibacillus shirakamiensis TaxID=1265935 RepID=A0ABS4JFP1_9BACL|nr:threonine-phosphate decarboxylase CobD [Paenibacillus shirakamiensis]MBP2000535.1 threonine-phosphate decarboxylase [Paenibacillus shirakamiensis]